MSEQIGTDRIDDVSAGDVITLDGEGPYRLVHVDAIEGGFLVTLEGDGGDTFDRELTAGTPVVRALESKWDSPQNPTHPDET